MAVSVCTIMFIKRKAGGNGGEGASIVKDDLVTSAGSGVYSGACPERGQKAIKIY